MNISVSAIGMYEQGRRVPGIELIQNLAKYFDVTTDYLLGYSDDRKGKISDDRFENELKSIVDDAADNNPSTASVLLHMGDLNGRVKAVEYMKSIPDIFLNILEDKKDDGRKQTD